MAQGNPFRCFDIKFLGLMLVAGGLIVALTFFGRGLEPGSPARIAVGVAQGVLIAFSIFLPVGAIRRLDELQLRIHQEAIVISFATTAAIVTAWRFVEKAGAPGFDYAMWLWPLMVLFWVVGLVIRHRQYR